MERRSGESVASLPTVQLEQNPPAVGLVVDVGEQVECLGDPPQLPDGRHVIPVPPSVPTLQAQTQAAQRRARRLATYDQVWTLHRLSSKLTTSVYPASSPCIARTGNAEELQGLSVQSSRFFSRTGLAALLGPE
jgi:hypothetical protein